MNKLLILPDHAAVDGNDLARDVLRIRSREERHALGDILRRTESLERNRVHIRLFTSSGNTSVIFD